MTLCASRYQAAAGLVPGRPAHRAADPQRVDPVAEDGEQRGQHGQRGQHVHRDRGHPAVAHRAQEVLGEQHQAGQRDRDRDAGDGHGPAGGGDRPGDRLLDGRLAVQFLAEPGDDEQPVVDAQAQAQDRGDVHRVDGHRGGQGEQPQHGERAEDGHAADRHRQRGRGQAAEDHQQQDQQDRHREALGLGDVGGDLVVDRDLHRHVAADLGRHAAGGQARGRQLGLDRVVGLVPGGVVGPGELEHRVGGVPVGADQAGRSAGPVRGHSGHVGARQPAQRGGDRLPVAGVADGHGGAAVQHDDIGVVPAEQLAGLVGFTLALAGGRGEVVAGRKLAEDAGAPGRGERHEHEREAKSQPPPRYTRLVPTPRTSRLPKMRFC